MSDFPIQPKINLLPPDPDKAARRHTILLAAVFTLLVAGVALFGARASYLTAENRTRIDRPLSRWPLLSRIQRFVANAQPSQRTSSANQNGRMNILLLGIGGGTHEGSLLTDTIMLASIDTVQNRVALLSIPRDLAYPLGEGRFEKINAVHAYEEQDHPGEGAKRAGELIGTLFDTPVDHVLRIDFGGFVSLINAIDGIDVTVERTFTDNSYPTADDGWMSVSFKKGVQHMTGERALIFVRSRHGNNGEGSDFARSWRQQLVLVAIRQKLLSIGTLANPAKLAAIYNTISNSIQSDLTIWDLLKLAPMTESFKPDRIVLNVLTDAPNGLLQPANVAGAFMLFPKNPDWSDLRTLAQNPFPSDTVASATGTKEMDSPLAIEVKNGTTRTNFASQAAAKLERDGYAINGFGNASRRGFERSMIFDLTNGQKKNAVARLQKLLRADVSTIDPASVKPLAHSPIRTFFIDPSTTERVFAPDTDFVVILGEASYALVNTATSAYASP